MKRARQPNDEPPPPCKICSKPVKWGGRGRWQKTCSRKCRLDDMRENNSRFMKAPPVHKGKMTERAVEEMLTAWRRT